MKTILSAIMAGAVWTVLSVSAGDWKTIPWLKVSESGIVTVENITGRISLQKPGWKESASENELNTKFVEQVSTIELDTTHFVVRFSPFRDWKPFRIDKRITVHGEHSVHWRFELKSPEAHPLAALGYTFRLPAETFRGKELRMDDETVMLPQRYEKLHLKVGAVKRISIPLDHGQLVLTGNFQLKLQDMRKWNSDGFSLHLHIPYEKPFRQAVFELGMSYSGMKLPADEFERKQIRFTPVVLDSSVNSSTVDDAPENGRGGWTDQGGVNDLRAFDKSGQVVLKGIPFRITDREKNGGRNCIITAGTNWKQYPQSVRIPLNGMKAGGFYFLHTSAWTPREIGKYVVYYSDGTSVDIPLRNMKEIFNWWTFGESDCSVIAWNGQNPSNAVGIGTFAWNNPCPEKPVEAVETVVYKENPQAIMMLLGLTASDGFPYLKTETAVLNGNIDDSGWIEVSKIDESSAEGSLLDVSGLVPAPAGKYGFVRVNGENFEFENGQRVRFIGMNIEAQHCFPDRRQAEFHARRLRRLGVNAIRLHKFDMPSRVNREILDPKSGSGELSAENLDRLEYFIAQLKKNGIYLVMDLQTLRVIGADECPPLAKQRYNVYGMFVPELIEAQKRFITRLLTHRNPYTGLSLAEDPALALIIFHNENSLLYQPNRNRITSPYACRILKRRFNGWLKEKYGDRERLAGAWGTLAGSEDPAAGTVELPMNPSGRTYSVARIADMRLFYYALQKTYYREIREHLRTLGVRVPMTGSNHWTRDPLDFELNAQLDYTDRHNYWSHPASPGSWLLENILFNPLPMSMDPGAGLLGILAGRRVLGKPFAVTEWNDGSTNEYRADAQLLFPAYSAMQNWHIFQFTYSTRQTDGTFLRPITYSFGIDDDPVQLALYPVITRMFLRGDIQEARREYAHFISARELSDPAYYLDPVDVRRAALYTRAGIRFGGGKADRSLIPNTALEVASETKELFWDIRTGRIRIDSPRTQGFAGFPASGTAVVCRNVEFRLTSDFAAVVLISCDGLPLDSSRRMLLATVARGWNKGMKYNLLRNRIVKAGTLPIVLQPVEGEVALSGKHAGYRVERMDISGRKLGECHTERKDGTVRFRLDHAVYYAISALQSQ